MGCTCQSLPKPPCNDGVNVRRGNGRWEARTHVRRTKSKHTCGSGLSAAGKVGTYVLWEEVGSRSWEETASLSPRIPERLCNERLWSGAENKAVIAGLWKAPAPSSLSPPHTARWSPCWTLDILFRRRWSKFAVLDLELPGKKKRGGGKGEMLGENRGI